MITLTITISRSSNCPAPFERSHRDERDGHCRRHKCILPRRALDASLILQRRIRWNSARYATSPPCLQSPQLTPRAVGRGARSIALAAAPDRRRLPCFGHRVHNLDGRVGTLDRHRHYRIGVFSAPRIRIRRRQAYGCWMRDVHLSAPRCRLCFNGK
jgi:hypothetical protein